MPLPYNSGLLLKVTSDSGAQFFADYSLNSDIERFGKEALELGLTGEAVYDYVKAETSKIARPDICPTLPARNLLVDYFEIIDTYIEGLKARTGLNFRSRVSILDTSVTIERILVNLPNVALPSFTFHFDNDILSKTDVYSFSVLLDSIKRLLTKTILQFDDQFYEDRYNGVPFVDDRKFEFNLQDGEGYKLIRVDEIDWKALFKVQ